MIQIMVSQNRQDYRNEIRLRVWEFKILFIAEEEWMVDEVLTNYKTNNFKTNFFFINFGFLLFFLNTFAVSEIA